MTSRPFRLLFQGDSITDAFRRPEEINPAYQLGNGYAFLAASRLALEHPQRFEFINRGISGQTVGDLVRRWDADTLALRPDVVSVLIGVNSTIQAMNGENRDSPGGFRGLYRSLLMLLREANPAVELVLVEPFVGDAGAVDAAWREHLRERQKGVRELAGEFQAVFVPAQEVFDEAVKRAPAAYWIYDGIHPTHAGAALLADCWLAAVRPMLEKRIP